ncbi:MAG: CHAP domain-containing protein [bacterium]|nr:CHAP domain-containing protein [bacterium]
MKRLFVLLLCLLPCLCLAEELDEEALLAIVTPTPAPMAMEETPELVYAASDVEESEEWERRIDPGEVPGYVADLLAVAEKEIGYTEGGNNRTKYGEWSGDPNAAWCAEFVCWCIDQVDQQNGSALLENVYPHWSGQNTGRDWFLRRGRFVYRKGNVPAWGYQWLRGDDHNLEKNEYIPRPGDLMFFSYNEAGDTEHVALVEYCAYDSEGRVIIHVIEGNNPSAVQRNRYRLDNSQVLGFGLPEDRVDTTIRYNCSGDKVLRLQQWLNKLGILAQRHLTGTVGTNTKNAIIAFQRDYMQGKALTGIADRETQQALEELLEDILYDTPDTWLVTE